MQACHLSTFSERMCLQRKIRGRIFFFLETEENNKRSRITISRTCLTYQKSEKCEIESNRIESNESKSEPERLLPVSKFSGSAVSNFLFFVVLVLVAAVRNFKLSWPKTCLLFRRGI